jgi:hypothetical protein
MASTRQQVAGQVSAATDRLQQVATHGVAGTIAAVDATRAETVDTLDGSVKAIDRQTDRLAKPLDDYADSVRDGAAVSARYVRRNDPRDMAADVAGRVSKPPFVAGVVIGAALVGGGLLLGGFLRNRTGGLGQPVSALTNALGPRAGDAFALFRDALVSLAIARAVEAFDEALPGFKGHFERAAQ